MPDHLQAAARSTPAAPGHELAGDVLAGALVAFGRLADLAETVEDEWTYVSKLVEVGRGRLRAAVPDPAARVPDEGAAAIAALSAEVARIVDPHRAIDWLSTFPAVAELTLLERRGDDPGRGAAGGA